MGWQQQSVLILSGISKLPTEQKEFLMYSKTITKENKMPGHYGNKKAGMKKTKKTAMKKAGKKK